MLHLLNRLLKSNAQWKWSADCQKAFEQAKNNLASAPVLTHYNVMQKLKLAVDTSAYRLGAIISYVYDDGSKKPIAYASHTLLNAERNYAQIDKEALALVFAVQRFHTYVSVWQEVCIGYRPQTISYTVGTKEGYSTSGRSMTAAMGNNLSSILI